MECYHKNSYSDAHYKSMDKDTGKDQRKDQKVSIQNESMAHVVTIVIILLWKNW